MDVGEEKGDFHYRKAKNYYPDYLDLTIEHAIQSIAFSDKNNQLELGAKARLLYGKALLLKFDKSKALKILLDAKDLAEKTSNTDVLTECNFSIGMVYSSLEKHSESYDYLSRALQLAIESKDTLQLPHIYNILAKYYFNTNDYDNTLACLSKAYEGFILQGDSIKAIGALGNTATVYYNLKDSIKALTLEFQAINMLNKIKVKDESEGFNQFDYYITKTSGTINLGYTLSLQKRFEEALDYTFQGIEIATMSNFLKWQVRGYYNLSIIYSQMGTYDKAYQALDKFTDLNDSLRGIEQRDKIESITLEYDAQQNEQKIKLLVQKSKIQVIYIIVISSFIVLVFVIFFLIYSRLKLKNKLHKKEKIEFELRMNQKSRELISSAVLISEKIKTVKSIKENIDKISLTTDNPYLNEFKEVKRKLRETIHIDNNWKKIKLHFQEIHPTFFKKLNEAHPSLSENELKHCAYIIMNIAPNDVAQLMNINIRSVQTARYRIKKKMELNKEDKLYEELFKF